MITRKQYMNNEHSFREYYEQFSSPDVCAAVANHIGPKKLLASTDEHLNDIPLIEWENAPWFGMSNQVAIANQSTYSQADIGKNILVVSLSDKVCAVKAAARKWIAAQ